MVILFLLSGIVGGSGVAHALEATHSPYRLSPAIIAQSQEQAAPYPREAWQDIDRAGDVRPYARQIAFAAHESGLDPELVHAVIAVESAYQASAISPKGAVGLMQLLPETARLQGVGNPSEVTANLRAGTRHLRDLMARFDQRLDLALAAYNAGEGAVRHYNNSVPPYPETRHYVPAVVARYLANRPGESVGGTPNRNPASRNYLPGTRLDPRSLQ